MTAKQWASALRWCLASAKGWAALMSVAIVLVAASCGGDDGPSREEFIASADAICAGANEEIAALGGVPTIEEPADVERSAEFWLEAAEIGQAAVEELKALEAPSDDEAVTNVVSRLESGFTRMEDYAAQVRAEDPGAALLIGQIRNDLTSARVAADELGFDACSELASSDVLFSPQ